jgi:CheY-like chemotaxis protein
VLVDDDVDDQEMFAENMSGLEHRLQVFSSGSEALFYLKHISRQDHPSLIVLDYNMPGMNGLDVLICLKQNDFLRHIPVVLYSSEMNDQLQTKLKAWGAVGCFQKSSDLQEMKEFLQVLGIIFEHSVLG